MQGGLIVFNHQQVVGALLGNQESGGIPLGVEGIGGDDHIIQRQWAKQLREGRNFIFLLRYRSLGQRRVILMTEG